MTAEDDMEAMQLILDEEAPADETETKENDNDTIIGDIKPNEDENDDKANTEMEEDKKLLLRDKALEVLGYLLDLPREDMLPYFQEIGACLTSNFQTQHDLGTWA